MDHLQRLFPEPGSAPFPGVYLAHDLRKVAQASGRTFAYANFVVSLDGRIAVPRADGAGLTVPRQIANDRDWRLFQELAAQADLIISSGRYLREWAEGKAQEILQVDDPRYADLRVWRAAQGLKPQPDIAIISSSLRFPIPDVLTAGGRRVVVFTHGGQDPARVREIERKAGRVVVAGDAKVDGAEMVRTMGELGYETVYSAAGPKVLHLLSSGNVLDRLYLTHASRLLGGDPFAAIVDGPQFPAAVDMKLHTLYFDAQALDGLGQLYAAYDRV